jgi:hypothetical protein
MPYYHLLPVADKQQRGTLYYTKARVHAGIQPTFNLDVRIRPSTHREGPALSQRSQAFLCRRRQEKADQCLAGAGMCPKDIQETVLMYKMDFKN